MSRKAPHIHMEHCDFCNGEVYRIDDEEYECELCGTVFRAKMGSKDESDE